MHKRIIRYLVYKITNLVNGKTYIGKTKDTLIGRWRNHLRCIGSKKSGHYPLYLSMAKYGVENFKIEVLEECATEQEMIAREIELTKEAKSYMREIGYNLVIGSSSKIMDPTKQQTGTTKLKRRKVALEKKKGALGLSVAKQAGSYFSLVAFENNTWRRKAKSLEQAKINSDKLIIYFYGRETIVNFPELINSYTEDDLYFNFLHFILNRRHKPETSKYRGVNKTPASWHAQVGAIEVRKLIYLGLYETKEEAALVVDKARFAQYGFEGQGYNFPDKLAEYNQEELKVWLDKLLHSLSRKNHCGYLAIKQGKRTYYTVKVNLNKQHISLKQFNNEDAAINLADMATIYYNLDRKLNRPEKEDFYRENCKNVIEDILSKKKATLNKI